MREKLRSFISYDDGEKVRAELHRIARAEYKPKHPDKYMEFMNGNACSFDVNHPQSINFPYYFTMFSCKSQHVRGDCVEECLDIAIDLDNKELN